jgi:Fe-S-cluster containining protein
VSERTRRETADTGGCTGACCAAFILDFTRQEYRTRDDILDGPFIADMLIPLSPKEARERAGRFGGALDRTFPWKLRGHYFTCRHWDEQSRLCTVYEQRPTMCIRYPDEGAPCEAGEGCTCSTARVGSSRGSA